MERRYFPPIVDYLKKKPMLLLVLQKGHFQTPTCVILARSKEGLCFWESAGLRRFMPTFLSLRTHGWERLRARPPCPPRRSSSGVESGELGGEGPRGSGGEICPCEWQRGGGAEGSEEDGVGLLKAEGQGPTREPQAGSRALQRAGRLKLELRCMAGKPSCAFPRPPPPPCWTLPPLWHLRFSTAVHRREP